MKTESLKDFAIDAVGHWFNLEVEDMTHGLPVGLTLEYWRLAQEGENFDVFIRFRALPGHNFEIWAHKNWRWDGRFSIYVDWSNPDPPKPEPHWACHDDRSDWNEYEIDKKPHQRPYVLDCRHGQLWMQASP